jgi:hypothetical protein
MLRSTPLLRRAALLIRGRYETQHSKRFRFCEAA